MSSALRLSGVGRLGGLAADPTTPATVLVTHHVEEIPAGFTQVLLLDEGRVAAAGPLDDVLSAESLCSAWRSPSTAGTAATPPERGESPGVRGAPDHQASINASRRGFDWRISSASRRSTTGPTRLPP
jgi:ABC-type multidrug transport system ATPase subunit